jgi:hypothetical protein
MRRLHLAGAPSDQTTDPSARSIIPGQTASAFSSPALNQNRLGGSGLRPGGLFLVEAGLPGLRRLPPGQDIVPFTVASDTDRPVTPLALTARAKVEFGNPVRLGKQLRIGDRGARERVAVEAKPAGSGSGADVEPGQQVNLLPVGA